MRIAIKSMTVAALLFSMIALSPARSDALFHLAVLDEVLASLDGDARQQFIEVKMLVGSQNLVSNAVLASFDASGTYIEDILILPNDVPNGVAEASWIAATEAFQTANGFTADFTMPAGIPLGGGMICFGAPGVLPPADPSSWDHTDPDNYVDCLAYGSYSGPSNHHVGTPTTLVPEGHSLRRRSETENNAADFVCSDEATPTNNAGEGLLLAATTPCGGGGRASGIQVTPDGRGVLVNKDVGDQRWTITRNVLTYTGNVFLADGGDPIFLYCRQEGEDGDDLQLSCSGAGSCSETTCPEFAFIAEVTLPESFFTPPTDVGGPLAARIQEAVRRATAGATPATGRALGGAVRASGIQITPDGERVLINKDVGDQRWSIMRDLGTSTVIGNIFELDGGDPQFLFCEQLNETDDSVQLRCASAASCSDTACPEFEFIADVDLPKSFFAVPGSQP